MENESLVLNFKKSIEFQTNQSDITTYNHRLFIEQNKTNVFQKSYNCPFEKRKGGKSNLNILWKGIDA